jgi:hypothetical protein
MEIKSVFVYKRYVDDILIIYDQEKTNHQQIIQTANNIHPNLSFKHELEDNGNIVFLDLTLHRNETNITIDIYRKPTTTSTVIHSNSNHSQEHKEAVFRFLLNRLHNLPLTEQQKQKRMGQHPSHSKTEWIHAKNNHEIGYTNTK